MGAQRQRAGRQEPAPPTVPDTPPIAGRDVILDTRGARPPALSDLERSNAALAEALAAFQWAVHRDAPQ